MSASDTAKAQSRIVDERWVVPLARVSRVDEGLVGGKAANLGELLRAEIPVPGGFVITAPAFLATMETTGVRQKLAEAVRQLSGDDGADLDARAQELRGLARQARVLPALRAAIEAAYAGLGDEPGGPLVAVRSSAVGEDSATASFAGANASFTNVRGVDDLLERVVDCWASLYGARSLAYRQERAQGGEPAIAVVVQLMVEAERSGVMFTLDPTGDDADVMVIEAALGLGEVIVSGQVEPDTYKVNRRTAAVLAASIGHQRIAIVPNGGGERRVVLTPAEGDRRVLDDTQLGDLARLAERIERHYECPQDIEFAIDGGGRTFIVQSRPITTSTRSASSDVSAATPPGTGGEAVGRALLSGLPASPGVATGEVRIVADEADRAAVRQGEILVAHATAPDWMPALRRAAAVVTDEGGLTCHAAIVCRELGVPAVVGTGSATTVLRDGDVVTVDGRAGTVTKQTTTSPPGPAATAPGGELVPAVAAGTAVERVATPELVVPVEPLATKIMVNLAFPERAAAAAALPVDGVGLLRAELILTSALDAVHPQKLVAEGRTREFDDRLVAALLEVARPFGERPVIYRTTDFRTNEFCRLEGGAEIEPTEANPMIGYRGCYRYVRDPAVFALELAALARAREEAPNLQVMIPFVRTGWELEACLELIDASPLGRQRGLQRWIMAEVPSVVWWLESYAQMGIDGVSIGSNDLTQLVLGVDRDSLTCSELFDESDRAVLGAIRQIIDTARRCGLRSSLCGQAPSNHADYAAHLVDAGIDSISVDPDAALRTRAVVAAAERRLLLSAARRDRTVGT